MLKNFHARLQYFVNQELPDVQAGIRKRRGTRDQIANIHWIIEKTISLCLIDNAKVFDCVDHDKLWKALSWEYQTILPVSWETCMWVKKQQLEPDVKQLTGSK